ncbi:MAG: pantoate kinase [Methanothermococcus sp.]|jgi:pantoate kinase|uniref:pantoate kinase n=1 Tax=Methanothermococcus TaxID=155862 RepID=UPI00036A5D07|nr:MULTISPECIES: pantoate kinase [Methanothermococcus]MDK2790446.1 pantoate kinase [Methanothermococcus sp.]MDK2987761.1 pantoate kinase [Methanothermococcus sp.]
MFIPGHITGFFKICKNKDDILKTGSTGAGINLNKGTYTELVEGKGGIYFNGEKIDLCPVKEVIKNYKEYYNLDEFDYNIIHKSDFPLGCGLGTSGSCTLGAAYGLSEIYKFINNHQDNRYNHKNKDNYEIENPIVKLAHISEVQCSTGLGDVIAQYTKGFVIRKKPGFPISVEKIHIEDIENYHVVVEILGKKETDSIINNPNWIDKINKTSDELLGKLLKKPTLKNFMDLSLYFAKNTGLANDKILEICDDLKFTLGASQAMLGNTIFCICEKNQLDDVLSILKNPMVCKIYQ